MKHTPIQEAVQHLRDAANWIEESDETKTDDLLVNFDYAYDDIQKAQETMKPIYERALEATENE